MTSYFKIMDSKKSKW